MNLLNIHVPIPSQSSPPSYIILTLSYVINNHFSVTQLLQPFAICTIFRFSTEMKYFTRTKATERHAGWTHSRSCTSRSRYMSPTASEIKRGYNISHLLSYSYTMGCPPVRGDNPRAFSEWIILRTGGQTW